MFYEKKMIFPISFRSYSSSNQNGIYQMLISILCIEPHKMEPFIIEVDQATLQRLDDEENYILINPTTKQCFINGEWINIPSGRIQADGQIEVHNAG